MPRIGAADSLEPASCSRFSSYAACVLMVELAMRCFNHDVHYEPGVEKRGFWDSHYALIKDIDQRTAMLQAHLNAQSVKTDPIAFSLQMNLCASEILFHEAAINEVKIKQLPTGLVAESEKRSTAKAFKIVSAVRLNWPTEGPERDIFTIQATFIAWPMIMAMKALGRELKGLKPGNPSSSAVANSLRMLFTALGHVEEADGHWHHEAATIATALWDWDERLEFNNVEL